MPCTACSSESSALLSSISESSANVHSQAHHGHCCDGAKQGSIFAIAAMLSPGKSTVNFSVRSRVRRRLRFSAREGIREEKRYAGGVGVEVWAEAHAQIFFFVAHHGVVEDS